MDGATPVDDEWQWFCSSCGHEWEPDPAAPPRSTTLAIENGRGGWLAKVRGHGLRTDALRAPVDTGSDDSGDGRGDRAGSYGERLRSARDASGRSLADAAASTGIRERYLRALEAEEPPEVFSAPAYARFFLREYAEALELSAGPLLDAFDARYPLEPEEGAPAVPRTPIHDPHPRRRLTAVTLVSISVVALVAIAVAARSNDDVERGALGTAPAKALVTTTPPVDPGGVGAGDGGSSPVRHIRAVLRLDAPCWVQATADGETTVARTLGTGERLVVRGQRRVDLELGDAGAVELTVNGQPTHTGGRGDVTTLTFRIRAGEIVSTSI